MDFCNNKINNEYNLNDELIGFFTNIIENYDKNDIIDKGHDKKHLYQVTNAMLFIGNELKLDLELCVAIGALHDIGLLAGNRKMHHKKSAEWVRDNKELLSGIGYSSIQISIIETSVFEHRSSSDVKSGIYSKSITDADKMPTHNVDNIIERSLIYTKHHNPGLSDTEIFEKMYDHIHDKYGRYTYGNKFYTKPAIDSMKLKNDEIIRYMNNKKLVLNKSIEILEKINSCS